ncbi:WXG100 family type VII secretion target [Nocardiopsis alba]|uniref:ESAT-6-like protein n=2 Tax=Nocardiopsidaceae TaxID=83676 RepID=A0A7K2ISY2_9ACTN|nr:WXG100 family type VII secretion target [Nocardiopsis sp. LDBS1602]MEC3893478.1 WXG100 family type VII secretion target [Nocardiopsis sp. LDBS1602]MYR33079.1 WXG100 family type VII secretion target [Nocardiopsis alba]
MPMDGFEIKYSGADDAGIDLRKQTDIIEQAINELDAKVQAVKSDWVGEAADQYDQRLLAWRRNVADMRALLGHAQVSLGDITERYRRGDLQEAGNWNSRR